MYQAKKMLLLGSGELGKEVVIEAQRLGVVTIAVDSYEHAPAMQAAHKSYVIDMLDKAQVREVIEKEKPDLIVPEVEAIATDELLKLEEEGFHVIPNARAAKLTMDREGIRRLAAETLHLPTAGYEFANTYEEFKEAAETIGFPCVVKPLMSSSGKGQSALPFSGRAHQRLYHARKADCFCRFFKFFICIREFIAGSRKMKRLCRKPSDAFTVHRQLCRTRIRNDVKPFFLKLQQLIRRNGFHFRHDQVRFFFLNDFSDLRFIKHINHIAFVRGLHGGSMLIAVNGYSDNPEPLRFNDDFFPQLA